MRRFLSFIAPSALLALTACAGLSGDAAFRAGDLDLAVKQYERAAADGDGTAALKLGQLYAVYAVTTGAHPEPVYWYAEACAMGTLAGCHEAGLVYEKGDGVVRDPSKALEFFSIAARRGYMQSQYQVGALYATGRIRQADPVDGYKWLLIARDRADAGFENDAVRQAVLTDADGYMASLESRLTPEQRRRALAEKRAWRPERP